MQTLEVTDEQYAAIQRLREAISADVVGKYGFVREQDAVQFLLDTLDGDIEADLEDDVAATDGSTATDDVAKAVDAAVSAGASVSYDESGAEPESDTLEEAGDDDIEDAVEEDSPGESDADPGVDHDTDEGDAPTDDAGGEMAEEDDQDDDDEDGTADDDEDGTADDDDMLDRMMNLLETHDDKWDESPSADYRYRVTLPDGSTEDVQTKDDVRAELFKNY